MDAYLCGHDHDLEYLLDAPEGEGVSYFVSGSGGQDVYSLKMTKEVGECVFSISSLPPSLPPFLSSFPERKRGCPLHRGTMSATHSPSLPPSLPPSPLQTVFAVAESGVMHHSFLERG